MKQSAREQANATEHEETRITEEREREREREEEGLSEERKRKRESGSRRQAVMKPSPCRFIKTRGTLPLLSLI
jgi:hypothetical protein